MIGAWSQGPHLHSKSWALGQPSHTYLRSQRLWKLPASLGTSKATWVAVPTLLGATCLLHCRSLALEKP